MNDIVSSRMEGLSADIAEKLTGDCNILFADPDLLGPIVYNMSKVQWVQLTWDGVDQGSQTHFTWGPLGAASL